MILLLNEHNYVPWGQKKMVVGYFVKALHEVNIISSKLQENPSMLNTHTT